MIPSWTTPRKRPTILYVQPILDKLLEHFKPKEGDSPGIAAVRSKAHDLLLDKVLITTEHKIARFLWPSQKPCKYDCTGVATKYVEMCAALSGEVISSEANVLRNLTHLIFVSQWSTATNDALVLSVASFKPELRRLMPDPNLSEASTSSSESQGPAPKRRKKYVSDSDLFRDQLIVVDDASLSKDDVQKYIEMKPEEVEGDEDKLNWWKTHGSVRFLELAMLAQEVFASPGSSASSERLCSDLGLLLSNRRNSMLPSTVDNTLTLRDSPRRRDL
ncbi:E3 SUMO-protein ligase ZBED1 [Frankliniella fusca]|uniref:E3 SUMO-protein ligase ZBED1 n=1 Tax=Frankliniella fusca TaxID=407009 RepID=A0AAE1HT70_9NEOP|nr:E3 SUMO-protein ligase ZBED1 [Frankliniella fusca]